MIKVLFFDDLDIQVKYKDISIEEFMSLREVDYVRLLSFIFYEFFQGVRRVSTGEEVDLKSLTLSAFSRVFNRCNEMLFFYWKHRFFNSLKAGG